MGLLLLQSFVSPLLNLSLQFYFKSNGKIVETMCHCLQPEWIFHAHFQYSMTKKHSTHYTLSKKIKGTLVNRSVASSQLILCDIDLLS